MKTLNKKNVIPSDRVFFPSKGFNPDSIFFFSYFPHKDGSYILFHNKYCINQYFMIYSQIKTNKLTFIKEKLLSVFNLFRGSDWWLHQTPKLLAVGYAEILLEGISPQKSITTVIALIASMFFVAAYGHVVNDTFDIDADLRANKPNRIAHLSKLKRTFLIIGLAIAGLIPWIWIGFIPFSAILLATLYVSLTIYAAPPLRLKERAAWGVFSDSFSVHLVPTLLVATVFSHLNDATKPETNIFAVVSTACYFLMGIRGIVSHQIADRENDLKSGVKTLITNLELAGVNQIRLRVTRFVLPTEIIFLVGMLSIICQSQPLLIVFFVFYAILSIINFKRWFFNTINLTYLDGYYIFPHDLYEVWLPLSLLCFLSLQKSAFVVLLILHILLFYPGIIGRWSSLSPIFVSAISYIQSNKNFWRINNFTTTSANMSNELQTIETESFMRSPSTELEISISKAIDFLEQNQMDDGEFPTVLSKEMLKLTYQNFGIDEEPTENLVFDSSPFVTSLILYSLSFLSHENKVKNLTNKGLSFLLGQIEKGGLWRYWSSKNKLHMTIPPDLDDISCISYVLKMNNVPFPDNTKIIFENRNDQGLFYTWVLNNSPRRLILSLLTKGKSFAHVDKIWNLTTKDDICCAVNANVAFYLGEIPQTQKLITYLMGIVINDTEDENISFYNHKLSFYYMLSRAYFNGVTSLRFVKVSLVNKVLNLQKSDGSFGDELLTALAISTLLNFNYQSPNLDTAVDYLLKTQQVDGSWQFIPFYGGHYKAIFGSAALTTAFCVEALTRYRLLDKISNSVAEEIKASKLEIQPDSTQTQEY